MIPGTVGERRPKEPTILLMVTVTCRLEMGTTMAPLLTGNVGSPAVLGNPPQAFASKLIVGSQYGYIAGKDR